MRSSFALKAATDEKARGMMTAIDRVKGNGVGSSSTDAQSFKKRPVRAVASHAPRRKHVHKSGTVSSSPSILALKQQADLDRPHQNLMSPKLSIY
jgi:hypothetical protein